MVSPLLMLSQLVWRIEREDVEAGRHLGSIALMKCLLLAVETREMARIFPASEDVLPFICSGSRRCRIVA